MESRRRKDLVLILAREFASALATPMFIADDQGRLVYFNEAAEGILGRSYAEAGEMPAEEWASLLKPEDRHGKRLSVEQMPAGRAFLERRASHETFVVTGLDGQKRQISATAFPLFGRAAEFLGVVAIFWEEPH